MYIRLGDKTLAEVYLQVHYDGSVYYLIHKFSHHSCANIPILWPDKTEILYQKPGFEIPDTPSFPQMYWMSGIPKDRIYMYENNKSAIDLLKR